MFIRKIGSTLAALMFAAAAAAQTSPAASDERQTRATIVAEFDKSFKERDYASIDQRYAQWIASGKRTGSGLFYDNVLVRGFFERPAEGAPLPNAGQDYWQPLQAGAEAWVKASPGAVLPVLALSKIHIWQGFAHRGGGYASTVTEDGWKNYRAYVQKAQNVLLSRQEQGTKDPNWWSQMLWVAQLKSMPMDQYVALANAAMDAFPGRHDIYFSIASNLTPQWGGSLDAIAHFADEAVRRTSKTEGKAFYARIYWHLYSNLPEGFVKTRQVNWPKIRDGFQDLVKKYPDPWNLNFYARMACDAGDKPTTKRLLGRIENQLEPSLWPGRSAYIHCVQWVAN